ncbi:MAG TPA: DUF58 domain-containing protein [bacterium]|nr:DUF58 domain-containing protein [bacterium]
MKRRYYRWYSKTYIFNEKLNRKFTTVGAAVFISAFTLLFFGLNTNLSMLFITFAVAVSLIITDALSLIGKFPQFKIIRFLPQFISKDQKLKYRVSIKNNGKNVQNEDIFYKEIVADPRPDYDSFISTPEPGEEKRNRYDRKMAYYRWKWLIERNSGGSTQEFSVTGEKIDDGTVFEAEFMPERRGKIMFSGAYLFRKGVFGLFKKGKVVDFPGDITVFPKILHVDQMECMDGSRNADSEKVRETPETGPGYELKSLREYVPGDSPRTIHWRSSAKTGDLKVKEFHKEVDAGTVMFIDNFFSESYSDDFEDLMTVAASLLNNSYEVGKMPQSIVIGQESFDIASTSRDSLLRALSALALTGNDRSANLINSVKDLTESAKECCSVIFLTSNYDEKRFLMIESLFKHKVPVTLIFTGERRTLSAPVVFEKQVTKDDLNSGALKL